MSEALDLNLIFPSFNARPVDKGRVKELVDSISEVGLLNPICVRKVVRHRGTTPYDAFAIIAGHHRYEAARALGWETIPAQIVDLDDLHAELAEIDENLVRSSLTPAQEASAIFRRKQIYEELHPETKHGAASPSKDCKLQSFVAATSEAIGKDKSTISRAAARGEALGADLDAVTGTSLDKGVELDALVKMEPDERAPIIERARAGEDVSARRSVKIVDITGAQIHGGKIDADVKHRCDRANAERAVEHLPHETLEAFVSDLFAAGHKSLAIEIKNLIGESIMDRNFGRPA